MAQNIRTSIVRSRPVLLAVLLLWLASPLAAAQPDTPTVVMPADGASGVSTSPTLSVDVTDPDGDSMDVSFYGRGAGIGENFTIVVLPDTQNYADHNQTNQAIFSAQTQWIVDNKDAMNIVFVTQVGDCVQFGSDFPSEWVTADAAFSLLEDPVTTMLPEGIPYGVAVGNHDQSPIGGARVGMDEGATTTQYNSTFGVSRFLGRGYYGGHFDFGNPALYSNNNDNHYQIFSAGGMDFIVIHLEYDLEDGATRAAALAWADSLLQTHSDKRAIVVSHYITGIHPGYIAPNPDLQSFGPQGQAIYDALKGNPNLFLMLSGHVSGVGRRVDTFGGNVVHSVLQNYQLEPNGGNGWLRIFEFVPSADEIRVSSYSPTLDQLWTVNGAEAWRAVAENEFTLPYEMNGLELIGSVSGIPNGGNANLVWPALASAADYEWFAEAFDGVTATTGPLSTFTTACAANVDCDDGNACTSNACNLTTGACESSDLSIPCDDGDICTQDDSCGAGVCSGAPVLECCVLDADCDDSSACTTDSCASNTCSNMALPDCCELDVDCDDANPCTTDTCDGNDAALSFDGLDDSVDLGNDLSITAFGFTSLTVEGWFNGDMVTENFKGLFHIGRRGPNAQFAVYLMVGNLIALGVEDTLGNPVDTAPAAFTMGQWNHFAAVLDRGTGQIRLYLNGNLVGSANLPGGFGAIDAGTDSTVFGALRGSTGALGTFYDGSLDEIRLWNSVRTQQNIQDNLNLQLFSAAGLIGRWGMNEGAPSPTIADSVGGNVGTLDGPAWIGADLAPLGASECSFVPIPACTLDCLSDTDCEDLNDCTDDVCNLTTELCEFTDNTAACDDGNVCTQTDTCSAGVCSGPPIPDCCVLDADCDDSSVCTIDSCVSNTCSNAPLPDCCEADVACDDGDPCTSDSCADNFAALSFDGVDDSVEFGNDASIVSFGAGNLTVEGWFNPGDNSSGFPGIFHIGRKGANSQLAVFFLSGPLAVGVEDTSARALDVPSAIAFNAGQWNHFAAVVDRSLGELRLYLNGTLAGSAALPAGFDNIEGGTENVAIGSLRSSGGVLDSFYTGALDEIRLWGVVRSLQEIQDGMDLQISTAPGLIARWGLNEGPPSTTTADSVDGNDGTLNGATWITSGLPGPLLGGCAFDPIPGCGGCTLDPECDDGDPCTDDACLPVNAAALSFDGTDDTVEFGSDASITSFGTGSLTVEGWFDPGDNSSGFPGIFHIGKRGANSQVAVFYFDGPLAFGVEDTTAKTLDIMSSIAVNAGQWNHFAAVVDRNLDQLRLYLNGALAASGPLPAGFAGIEGGTENVAIGALRSGAGVLDTFYTGALDEIRLWGVARSQQEIQDDMHLEVTSAPGLIARWGLNEGSPSTTTADSVGMNDGTLNGAAWIASGLVDLSGACVNTPIPDCLGCTTDNDCADSDLCTIDSCDPGTGTCGYLPDTQPGCGVCASDGECDDGDPCTDETCSSLDTAALSFDGTNDTVEFGNDASITSFGTGSLTVEGWFDPGDNSSGFPGIFHIGRRGANSQVAVFYFNGPLAFGVEDTTANALDITSAIAVNAGQWNHFAAVLDRNLDELRLYLNGALAASSALPAGFAGIEGGTDNVAIGALRNGTTGVLDTFYTGALDEIRLWGVARTQQEIQDDMNLEVTSAPGLIARWGLNEGSPSSTTADSVGMNDGTLNGATWIAGGLAPLGQCSITAVPGCIPCSSDPECTDSNPCTLNSCDLATNRCLTLFEPMGAACADGDLCNGDEQCDGAGACFAGDPPDCDDGVLCTVDGCDATLGCVQTPDDLLCDDGDPCTDDACDVGGSQCVHTPVPDCVACGGDFLPLQDFNTVPGDEPADWFDSGAGNVLTLDDNFDVQNVGGELALGTTSALVNIHSHYITAESANWADYTLSTRGLVTSSNAGWGVTVLSDFPNSDTYYRLRMGSFRRTLHLSPHGTFPDCGGNDVGDTGFEPVVGEWFRVKVQVEDDGANTFIRAKAWPDDGTAEPANWQTECIDSDPSTRRTRGTVGLWSMSSGGHYWDDVQVVSNTGAGSSCDDGDACNGLETCQAGFCANGTPPICDDGDPCNGVETCDPASGCQGGMALDCDDGNPCTTDSCNPAGGCINDPLAAGSPCGDGNACNGDETCDDFAVCQDGVAPICDDGTVCNGLESCDPIDGCQSGVPLVCTDANVCNGLETCDPIDGCQPGTLLVCDDGNDCNGLETCDAMNGCELGSPIDCDDGDPCTADSCVVATGACLNDPIPACEPDARVVPIVSLVDPATTPETTVPIAGAPPSEAFVPAGQDFWVEVWATDSGVLNTGLVAVYVDVVSCGDPVAMDVGHGSVFNVLSSGTIGAGLVDDFGGSAVADGDPSNDGIEPDWVRIGWIRHQADASLLNCEIRVQASGLEPQLSALGRGLVPWSDVQLGSTIVSAGQSVPSVDYDLDGDGVIGPGDLALFYVSFGMTVPPGDVAHDFDCDGTVGPVDLAWFQSGWMKPVGDPTLQYSPECP